VEGTEAASCALGIGCGLVLLTLFVAAIALTIAPLVRERDRRFAVALMLLAAIMIAKLALLPFFPGYVGDINQFQLWGWVMARLGPAHIYDPQYVCRYTPGYLYALWPSAAIASHLQPASMLQGRLEALRISIEAPPIIADFLLCISAYAALRRTAPEWLALPGTLLLALNPAMIYTSTVWGQNDSALMLPVLLSLLLAADSRYPMAWAMAAIAVLIKAQGLLLLPILAWWTSLTGGWPNWLRSATAFISTAIVVIAPFQLAREWHFIIDVYGSSLGFFPFASVNAFNLMAVLGGLDVPDNVQIIGGISYFILGNSLLAMVCVFAGRILWHKRTERSLLFSSFLVYLALFVLGTRIHERYLYFAVVMLTPLIFESRATIALYAVLTATLLLNLVHVKQMIEPGFFLYGRNPIATAAGIVNLAAFAVAAGQGFITATDRRVLRWPAAFQWWFSPAAFARRVCRVAANVNTRVSSADRGLARSGAPEAVAATDASFFNESRSALSGLAPATRLSVALLLASLITGVALRTVWLDKVPPGFHHDEACNGYDAYSILQTGRDQHGNLFPILVQAFNDYRMPLFDYSLIPLIAAFGLKPSVVRLGAAIWGIVDLGAVSLVAGLMLGLPGAAITALLGALSPWQISLSRFGAEYITASATVSLAMACFFLWLRKRDGRWLILCGVFFGLSLYSHAITRVFTVLMILLLSHLYRRELARALNDGLLALGMLVLFATPQIIFFLLRPAEALLQFKYYSLFEQATAQGGSLWNLLALLCANFAAYFSPSFLLLRGDRGDLWSLLHVPGFGELLPAQAVLVLLGVIAFFSTRRAKLAGFLLVWLLLATVPAALTVPPGAWPPAPDGPHGLPTASVLINSPVRYAPLTPSLLFANPSCRRDLLAIAPWILLSALGFMVLIEFTSKNRLLRAVLVSLLLAAIIFSGGRFIRSYFRDYPTIAAPFFSYGMDKVVKAVEEFNGGQGPAAITDRPTMPYIFVLFFGSYDPALFQRAPVTYGTGISPPPVNLFAPVTGFDRYLFFDPNWAFSLFPHGIFVFSTNEPPPAHPAIVIRYPDGSVAYNVVTK